MTGRDGGALVNGTTGVNHEQKLAAAAAAAAEPLDFTNILFAADSYKVTHHSQYPPGTQFVYSYFESRGGKFPKVVFFGLQYLLKRYLVGVRITEENVRQAADFYAQHFQQDVFNRDGWLHIVRVHGGRLPLRIRAVAEGTVVDVQNVLFTVENTDPEVPWLTNWVETLLVQCWYPITVATSSRAQKTLLARYLAETSDSMNALTSQLHDFGFRGSTSVESAGIGAAAHLVNFTGTDTVAGLLTCRTYYGAWMAGFSTPASEHSTMTAWGRDNELDAYRNMLDKFPNGVVSVVSDSYDIYAAVRDLWGEQLRDEVLERAARGGGVVIRPDSGDPPTVVCKILESLGESYGFTTNSKGFRVLPRFLRVLQGDGIYYEMLIKILDAMKAAGWSSENVIFGSGGGLLQRVDRDTQKCAFKCSRVIVNGEQADVCKAPSTDRAKHSKLGVLTLERNEDGSWSTVERGEGSPHNDNLELIFENGRLLLDHKFEDIRTRAELDDDLTPPRNNGHA